jgi:hypothetical protein
MRDIVPSTGRPALDKPRARRDASKMLGIALQTRYRKLLAANGEDETVIATADLAQCMYENVEFVIWALKHVGGMNPPPPEELRRITAPQPQAANDPRFVKPPALELQDDAPLDLPCSCPPLEAGIIGRDRHMTSCPKFVP